METTGLSAKQIHHRRWYQKNKDKVKANNKKWLREHPERAKAMRRAKYLRARDRLRAEYRDNRISIVLRKHGVDTSTPEAVALIARYDDGCSYCGEMSARLQVDHKLPTSRGGGCDVANLQWLCGRCNLAKSDMTEDEFLAHIKVVLDRITRRSLKGAPLTLLNQRSTCNEAS